MAAIKPLKIGTTGLSSQFEATDTVPIGNLDIASQAEAESGVSTSKIMTPQRTAQAISALGGGGVTDGFVVAMAISLG